MLAERVDEDAPAPAGGPAHEQAGGELAGAASQPRATLPDPHPLHRLPRAVAGDDRDPAVTVEGREHRSVLLSLQAVPVVGAGPQRRLPGLAKQVEGLGPEHERARAAAPDRRPGRPAALRGDSVSALPGLQVGLRAAEHVPGDRVAGVEAQIFDPVGDQPVMGGPVGVDVERPLAADLAVEGDVAAVGGERVGDGIRILARARQRPEAVGVRAEAPAEEVIR